MKSTKYLFVIIIVVKIISCSNDSVNETNKLYYNHIIKNDKGIIRGVYFNQNPQQIKKKERGKVLVTDTETILEYEYQLDTLGTYVVAYQFDQKGCYEIDIDVYLTSNDFAAEAQKTLNAYFSNKYGSPTEKENLLVWKDQQKTITVELDYLNKSEGELMLTVFANE